MLILGMDVAKSDTGGIMVLRSGKLMVLKRQPGYLWTAESELYKIGMGWSAGSAVKRYKNNF